VERSQERPSDAWLLGGALLSLILCGIVQCLIQLVGHRTYWTVRAVAIATLASAWWLVRGRHIEVVVPRSADDPEPER
jgi:hypothetical protein